MDTLTQGCCDVCQDCSHLLSLEPLLQVQRDARLAEQV